MKNFSNTLLEKWSNDFLQETGYEFRYLDFDLSTRPCLVFDVALSGSTKEVFPLLKSGMGVVVSLHIWVATLSPRVRHQEKSWGAIDIMRKAVIPFFQKRYGIISGSFRSLALESYPKEKMTSSTLWQKFQITLKSPFLWDANGD